MRKYLFLLLVIYIALIGCKKKQTNQRPQPPARLEVVLVEAVELRDLHEYIRLTGTLEGKTDINLISEVSGQIVEIFTGLGNTVKVGEAIARIDNADYKSLLDQAEVALISAEANLTSAEAVFQANINLYERELLSEAEYQNSVATFKNAQAQKLGAQATFDQRKRTLDNTRFVSPVYGEIVDLPIRVGQAISVGSKVAGIVDVYNLVLKTGIGEGVVSNIQRGQTVSISHRNSELSFSGKVSGIGYKPLNSTANYPLEIEISNTKDYLLPGMIVNGEILSHTNKKVIYTLQSNIIKEFDDHYLYVINENNIAQKRKITLGKQVIENVIIASGLQPGDIIIIEGADKVDHGMKVEPKYKN
ncbi:MAG: efflux RND transporter periplasmic adaptor subunit [Candidatus Cloacimonetes bacterium]|nr:efflux RND transporter periplasmic adaptor subunit [Candidatus Cloacimonadota bacterium]